VTEVARGLAHANVLLGLKRYDEAASLLARIVAAEPQNSRAWCLLAATHLGKGRYQEAAAAASSAITLAPFGDWPYRLASSAQRHLGKTTAAISSATEACRLAPHEWRAYICLAEALLATQTDNLALSEQTYYQYCQAAEQAAATALRLAPHEPDAHCTAGQVSCAQRKWKAARAHQERALALNPAHSAALNELGRISLRRGGSPRAARHFLQAARLAPGVSTYGRNAELSVRRVLVVTIIAVYLASGALGIALAVNGSRWPAVVGFALAIALVTGYAAVQLWRMPPDLRVLLRTRRAGLAVGALYGAVFIEVIAATVTSARALPVAVSFAVCAVMVALYSKTGRA
jgi:tetratricopeptide (TPR) repeat protein